MSQKSQNASYALIELMLGFQEAAAAAGTLLKNAHAEGRVVSPTELKAIRAERASLMADLDKAIAQAEAEAQAQTGGSP